MIARHFLRGLVIGVLALAAVFVVVVGGFVAYEKWAYYLPSQDRVLARYTQNRVEFRALVQELLKAHESGYIGPNGDVNLDGINSRHVPSYALAEKKLGLKFITIGDSGIEFVMYGNGGAIADDSYMGIAYRPKNGIGKGNPGWKSTLAASLDDKDLPKEKREIETGFYVVPIEGDWYLYRLEYRE